MALFKIAKGLLKNLPKSTVEGFTYFTTDTGELYIDTSSVAVANDDVSSQEKALLSRTMISSIPFIEGTNANAEGAWLADHPGLQLRSGLAILYKMDIRGSAEQEYEVTYRNFLGITTAKLSYTELNLNNFGWKKCYYDITTPLKTEYAAGEILLMVYDSTLDKGSGGWLVLSGRSYDAQTL